MDTPVGQLMNVVVDCPDAGISARFWAAVLGWERVQENAGSADIADPSDTRRRLVFQQIADHRPPGRPDQGPPQQHNLDVRVDDLEIFTISFPATTVTRAADGTTIIVSAGTVTSGPGQGEVTTRTVVRPRLNPDECGSARGVTQESGPVTLVIAPGLS